jgi:hypothetical protein
MAQKQSKTKENLKKPSLESQNSENKNLNILHRNISIALSLLVFILYGNTLYHQFAFDDSIVIVENSFTQKGIAGTYDLATKDFFEGIYGPGGMELTGGRFRPLSLVSFAIENQLFGKEKKNQDGSIKKDTEGNTLYDYPPFWGHLLNILFYFFSILLSYHLLRIWFPDYKNELNIIPLLSCMIFLTHPIHTEVVANIKSRDEIYAYLLLILSLFSVQKPIFQNKNVSLFLACLCFMGAMLSKESAFTFVLIYPIIFYTFNSIDFKTSLVRSIPFFVMAFIYFVLRSYMVGEIKAETNTDLMENPFYQVDLPNKLATISLVLFSYVKNLFIPIQLSSDYSREQITIVNFGNPWAILGLLFHVCLAVYVLIKVLKKDVIAVGILIYFLPLSLTINLFFNIGAPMADRFLYIPSFGFSIIVAYIISRYAGLQYFSQLKSKIIFTSVIGISILLFSWKTIDRNQDWYNNETLFAADVKNAPSSAKMNYYYANTLFKKFIDSEIKDSNLLVIAEKHFKAAIDIYPKFHTAQYNLGFIAKTKRNGKEAESHLLKTLSLQPGYLNAIEMLGQVYGELLQDLPNSEKYILQAIAINKQRGIKESLASNYKNLAIVYAMQQKFENAINICKEAILLSPQDANIYMNMGIIYQQMGQGQASQEAFETAFKINPALRK